VTNPEKVKEPRKTKAAPREKTSKAKEPVQKKQQAAPEAKEPVKAAVKKAAVKKEAPKKAAPKKAGTKTAAQAPALDPLESLRLENEALRAQLVAANARADRLFVVTGDVVTRLDSVITLIRGLVEG
jgi:hypothetical protein